MATTHLRAGKSTVVLQNPLEISRAYDWLRDEGQDEAGRTLEWVPER